MMKKILAGVVALSFVLLLGYRVEAARNATQARAEDQAQIEYLMWKYSRALTAEDPDAYAALYTPDGQFGTGTRAVKGHDALKQMIVERKQRGAGQPPVYAMDLDSHVEFRDRDHARWDAYWLEVSPRSGPNVPARVVNVGRDVEQLERVNGQWFIQVRDATPKN